MKVLLIGGRAHGQVHYFPNEVQSVDATGSVYRPLIGNVHETLRPLLKQEHDAIFLSTEIGEPAAFAKFVAGLRQDGERRR
ncbi:MAG TPA: hypothetical protein VK660_08265 [Xanthomonadaceae bacterium]|jgi:hypothetical protein|nr:hypothetical protein [Xanthomonadaceae bacterium]